jgi:hypothetical protein
MIRGLGESDPALYSTFLNDRRKAEGESHFVRNSGRYPLCGVGDINTYAIFAEMNRVLMSTSGRVGCIVPSGIATDDTTKRFFQEIVVQNSLVSLYDFQSSHGLFAEIGHARFKFCLLTLAGVKSRHSREIDFAFFLRDVNHLNDSTRRFSLSAEDIALLNPNTRTCPIFRTKHDAELTKAIYRRVPVLWRDGDTQSSPNPWGVKMRQGLFHLTNDCAEGNVMDAAHVKLTDSNLVGIYEAKQMWQFDHRFSSYPQDLNVLEDKSPIESSTALLQDSDYRIGFRYFSTSETFINRIEERYCHKWWLVYRDITNATNERTTVAAIIPHVGVAYTLRVFTRFPVSAEAASCFYASLNSYVFDYCARQLLGGTHLSDYIFRQLPVLPPSTYGKVCAWSDPSRTLYEWLVPRVLELTYTARDLRGFAEDCGYTGESFRWDEERRFLLRCELDAAYFHLYGIGREDVDYILDTFPIVLRKDEQAHGEYRTKRVILEIYDEMRRAMESGTAYQTRLDPPPANGWAPPELAQEEIVTKSAPQLAETTDGKQSDLFVWQAEDPQQRLKFEEID